MYMCVIHVYTEVELGLCSWYHPRLHNLGFDSPVITVKSPVLLSECSQTFIVGAI